MNHVNLIGKMTSEPRVMSLENGRKVANFSLKTVETFLDKDGNVQKKSQWHRIHVWGRWVAVIEEFGQKGLNLAVEGRLTSRFYKSQSGTRHQVTEIEVNDLVLL